MAKSIEVPNTAGHELISGVSESKLKAKIEDVLNDISKMEKHGEWYGFMHSNENAAMITKLWNHCR